MENFSYQLQMSGYSVEQYAKMMGGDLSTMRNAFRPAAEKQAKANVTLAKIAEVEGITATEEDINAELEAIAKNYGMEVEKVKEIIPAEELTASLVNRKAIQVIVDNAVATKPKAEKKPAAKKATTKKSSTKKAAEKAEETVEAKAEEKTEE